MNNLIAMILNLNPRTHNLKTIILKLQLILDVKNMTKEKIKLQKKYSKEKTRHKMQSCSLIIYKKQNKDISKNKIKKKSIQNKKMIK